VGDKTLLLSENQSTYIPLGEVHRLANPGKVPLEIIEVQSGSYLGEDDIVRLSPAAPASSAATSCWTGWRQRTSRSSTSTLTYAGNLREPGQPARRRAPHLRAGRHRRPRLVDRLLAEHRPRAIVTSPPRATSTAPSTARAPSSAPTSRAPSPARGRARLLERPADDKAAFRFLHVSTDEVYGS
jgi:hypothetical protein